MKHLCTVNVKSTLVYLTDPTTSQEAGLHDISAEVLQFILTQLLQASDQFGVTIEQKDAFLRALTKGMCPHCPYVTLHLIPTLGVRQARVFVGSCFGFPALVNTVCTTCFHSPFLNIMVCYKLVLFISCIITFIMSLQCLINVSHHVV